MVHDYATPGSVLNSFDVYAATRANTYLFLNYKPAGNWTDAGGGNASVNANIDKMANSIKSNIGSKKMFITIWHEPENDAGADSNCPGLHYKGPAGNTPTAYKNMWKNVRNRFTADGVTNIVWAVDYMNYQPWACLVPDLYPGDNLVDWIVFNGYSNNGGSINWGSIISRFTTLLTSKSGSSTSGHDYLSKPWGISEWGIDANTQANAYQFYDNVKASLDANTFPNIKLYMIFDAIAPAGAVPGGHLIDEGSNLQYDQTEVNHYKALANDSHFAGSTATTSPPPPPPTDTQQPTVSITGPTGGKTVGGSVTLTANASDNVGVVKVNFIVDDTVIATDTTAPYTASWNTGQVSNGTHTIKVAAFDAAGNKRTPLENVTVNNTGAAPLPQVVSFTASPSTVTVGNASTLKWSTANAVNCSVSPNGPQKVTATSWTSPAFTNTGSQTYTLTCYNSAGKSVSSSLTVKVNPAPTPPGKPSFSADKTSVQQGSSVLLSWSSSGATACVLNPGNVSSTGGTGSKLVSDLRVTTTYTISCSNNAGSASASLSVKVVATPPPPADPQIVSFTANPTAVTTGEISTLSWTTSNVATNGCTIQPSLLTSAAANGQWQTPALQDSVSYVLTCKNTAGVSVNRSVSITVNGVPAPPPPPSVPSKSTGNSSSTVKALGGQKVVNAQNDDKVSQGQLVTLDPSNVLDGDKVKSITRVEYYDGETLLQTAKAPPYVLNTKQLKPGQYSVTERTYYADGSVSERTQDITITAAPASAKVMSMGMKIGIGVGIAVLVAVAGLLLRRWWTRRLLARYTGKVPEGYSETMPQSGDADDQWPMGGPTVG